MGLGLDLWKMTKEEIEKSHEPAKVEKPCESKKVKRTKEKK